MTIEIVYFDVYGTLAGFDPPREVVQQKAAAKFGLRLDKDGIDAGYRDADHLMAEQNSTQPLRLMTPEEQLDFFARYERLVLKGAGHDVDFETAKQIWKTVRAQDYGWALFPDVLTGFARLQEAGYRLAALSNMPYSAIEMCDMLGLTGHIEFAITSGDVGAEKPDPRIFHAALDRGKVSPEKSVMVGDSINSDLRAAESAGMKAILMDRYNNHPWHKEHPRVTTVLEAHEALINLT